MSRPVERFEFSPEVPGRVVAAMGDLFEAGDGWINLLPGIAGEGADAPEEGGGSLLFGARQPAITMGTWVPPKRRRRAPRGGEVVTLGIMHPRGRHAVRQLASLGVPLPDRWYVRQDHQRRGLVLRVPADVPQVDVLAWALRAALR